MARLVEECAALPRPQLRLPPLAMPAAVVARRRARFFVCLCISLLANQSTTSRGRTAASVKSKVHTATSDGRETAGSCAGGLTAG